MATNLPDVTLTIQDGGLGLDPQPVGNGYAAIGACAGGTPNTVYTFSDRPTLYKTLLGGPLVESVAYSIALTGGPVTVVPATLTSLGSVGSVTQTGPGPALTLPTTSAVYASGTSPSTVTLTGTPTIAFNLVVAILTTGARGTATFEYSTDGGVTYSTPIATAATFLIPGTGVTINFASGTYTNDNVYKAATCVPYDAYELVVRIVAGGALGIATFQYALDGNNPSGPTWSGIYITPAAADPVAYIGGTGLAITFAAVDVVSSSGTSPPAVTLSGTPTAPFNLVLNILTTGTRGTATFVYSLDGGVTFSSTQTTAATFLIPNTGVTVNFPTGTYTNDNVYTSSTYLAGTTYAAACTAPAFSNSGMTTAYNALVANPQTWEFVHVIGQAGSASASATQAAALAALLEASQGVFRYDFGVLEAASDTDANLEAAFAPFADVRTVVAASFERLIGAGIGATAGMTLARSAAWPAVARGSELTRSQDWAQFDAGPLPGVVSLVRDEFVTQGLDAARFLTLRTYVGANGFYITNGRIMAPGGSDFILTQYRAVMDLACAIARQELLPQLNKPFRVNKSNGTIYEVDARNIERIVNGELESQLVQKQPQQANAAFITLSRTNNLVTTQNIPVTVNIQPLGYSKTISVTIGFVAQITAAA